MRTNHCLRVFALLLSALLLPGGASAWGYEDTLAGNMQVEVFDGERWLELRQDMYYSHENGRLADGILMFMPLEEFLRQREIPSVTYSAQFAYRVTCTPFVTSCSVDMTLHRKTEAGLVEVGNASLSALEPGVYLLSLNIAAKGRSGNSTVRSMVWLTVGSADAAPPAPSAENT